MADPVLRAFDQAIVSYQDVLQYNQGGSDSRPPDSKCDASDVPAPLLSLAPPTYVHHGYQAAARELAHRKAAEDAAEQPLVVAQPANEIMESIQQGCQSPELDTPAEEPLWPESSSYCFTSAINEAQKLAHRAWQRASQASSQYAADVHAFGASASQEAGKRPTAEQDRLKQLPPQPPPPPDFAWPCVVGWHPSAKSEPQSSLGTQSQEFQFMQQQARALGQTDGDNQLEDLLMAWFHCGYQSGIRHVHGKQQST